MTARTRCGSPRLAGAGRRVTVFGWVDRRRDHGSLTFLDVRDTTGILQDLFALAHIRAKGLGR